MSSNSGSRKMEEVIFWQKYLQACQNSNANHEIAKCLRSQIGKATLEINKAEALTIDDWKPLLSTLSRDNSLHYIAISATSTRYKVLESLVGERDVRSSRKHPALYSKYLMNWLSNALSNSIASSRCLTSLYLSKIPIKDQFIVNLANGLGKTKCLQHLSLHHCPIEDEGCTAICKALASRPSLTTLDLTDCALGPVAASQIAELVKKQCCHRVSEVWKGSLRYGKPAGDDMPGLRRLTLNLNPNIGDKGIIELTSALYDDLWIKGIDMQGCGVKREGGYSVLRLLDDNHCITVFDLRCNPDVNPLLPFIMARLRNNLTHSKPGTYKCRWMEEVQPPSARVSDMTLVHSSASTLTLPRSDGCMKRGVGPSWLSKKKSLPVNNIRFSRSERVSKAQSLDGGIQRLRFCHISPPSSQPATQDEIIEEEYDKSDEEEKEDETIQPVNNSRKPLVGVSRENNQILANFKKAILNKIRPNNYGNENKQVNIQDNKCYGGSRELGNSRVHRDGDTVEGHVDRSDSRSLDCKINTDSKYHGESNVQDDCRSHCDNINTDCRFHGDRSAQGECRSYGDNINTDSKSHGDRSAQSDCRSHEDNRPHGDADFVDIPHIGAGGDCCSNVLKKSSISKNRIKKAEAGDAGSVRGEKHLFREKTHQLLRKLVNNRHDRGLETNEKVLKVCSQLNLPSEQPEQDTIVQPSASFSTFPKVPDKPT